MRATLGQFKMASRDSTLRRSSLSQTFIPPTPFPIANSAVRRYHLEGPEVALSYIEGAFSRSDYWGPAGTPSARGWAEKIRECFGTYVELSDQDDRPSLNSPINTDVFLSGNHLGVQIDVVLLDPNGYVARFLLWDIEVPTRAEAELLAVPLVLALEQELGEDRVVGAEIWHLRSSTREFVTADQALQRVDEAATILTAFLDI